jgi:hypothetical protein
MHGLMREGRREPALYSTRVRVTFFFSRAVYVCSTISGDKSRRL